MTPTPTTPAPGARVPQVPGWFLVLALAWCLAMGAVPWLVATAYGPRLPDPLATHWGVDGRPDGFAPLADAWIFPIVFTLAMTAFLLGLGAVLRQVRAMVPAATGLAAFIGVLIALTLVAQADGNARTSSVDLALVGGIAAGLVAAGLWALLLRVLAPRPRWGRRPGSRPPRSAQLPIGTATRVSWIGPVRASTGARILGWLVAAPFAVLGVIFAAFGQWGQVALMVAIGAALVVLVVAFLHATVVVDSWGLRARVLGRFTPVAIPLAEIESARVVQVHWGEFGGIGLRARIDTDGSWGLVTGSGEAVRIERAGTGPFFLTVSPAAEVASALNTLVARDETVGAEGLEPPTTSL